MSVEEIPADEITLMTGFFHRAFCAAGCRPACHCCGKDLPVGSNFKLATVETFARNTANSGSSLLNTNETREVMFCDTCTIAQFDKKRAAAKNNWEERRKVEGRGCFRVNGKIVL